MSEFERKTIELELRRFTARNFERPSACKNLDQIRFYVQELCRLIEDHKKRFDYVPSDAYALLAQYNARQNSILYQDFISTY